MSPYQYTTGWSQLPGKLKYLEKEKKKGENLVSWFMQIVTKLFLLSIWTSIVVWFTLVLHLIIGTSFTVVQESDTLWRWVLNAYLCKWRLPPKEFMTMLSEEEILKAFIFNRKPPLLVIPLTLRREEKSLYSVLQWSSTKHLKDDPRSTSFYSNDRDRGIEFRSIIMRF